LTGLAKYVDEIKADVERKGYTETFFGRRRYFEGINSNIPYIKAMAERMAVNAPFQGTNADIIKIAMKHIDDWSSKMVMKKTHFFYCKYMTNSSSRSAKSHDKIIPEVKKIMETVVDPKDTKGVICAVNAATGK
jgi:DNA polymerase I-like protein with 3'-5' exonuclease and polymerase domains